MGFHVFVCIRRIDLKFTTLRQGQQVPPKCWNLSKQDRQCMYNVTQRFFHATIIAVEKK